MRKPRFLTALAALVLAVTVLAVAACGSAASNGASSSLKTGGTPVAGGTAYFAEQPLETPTYIFPLVSGENFSTENTADFQTLMYEPLYWYGNDDNPAVDYAQSLASAPVYSDGNKVVTITLKHYVWSDGETLSARDVGFWINLLKANEDEWASYVPGGFPDNVVSWTAVNQTTIRLKLNASYNPTWFTYNELSQITPLPIAWDRTSLTAPVPSPTAGNLPDTTTKGAWAVYSFLNKQAEDISGYASSPIWSVVDGPWKLAALTSAGEATFVPNTDYSGPDKPHLAKFVELPYTSTTSEFSVLRAGSATGGPGTSGEQVTVGYVPDTDLPQRSALSARGYQLTDAYAFGFDYFEPNFNNPTVGPILRQLYFRQAFQHLVDQTGWIHAYYDGLGVPTYSPVPASPANPYSDALANVNPYPFSLSDATSLLTKNGWKVVPNGVTTCVRPGDLAGECGAGIKAGEGLKFTLMYPSGTPYTDGAMVNLQSDAREAGIQISLDEVTSSTIDEDIEPCTASQASCSWELGNYGGAWVFEPDHYPSGEEIFETGALGNVNNYSDPAIDKLIEATTTASAADAPAALDAYADAVRLALPDFWQPSPGTLVTVASNLRGYTNNAYGFINPEQWYFTKSS